MTVRVSIIGSGFGMYAILPAFSKIKNCEVVSICGKNSERMLEFCNRFGVKKIYTDWREMLEKERPDAVAIAVVPKFQYEIAEYALKNRIAIFAEKPLTHSYETSLKLFELLKEGNLPNMIDFIFPEISTWKEAKKILEDGTIGKILNVNVDWNFMSYDLQNCIRSWKTNVDEGGGALSFFFSHVFYYLEYFLGKIKTLECVTCTSEKSLNHGETIINTLILFENGCIGSARMNISHTGIHKHSIEFHGESGTISLQNNNSIDKFELFVSTTEGRQEHGVENNYVTYDTLEDPRVKLVKSIAERFVNWCSTGVSSKPDFQDGLRVQQLIEIARSSSKKY